MILCNNSKSIKDVNVRSVVLNGIASRLDGKWLLFDDAGTASSKTKKEETKFIEPNAEPEEEIKNPEQRRKKKADITTEDGEPPEKKAKPVIEETVSFEKSDEEETQTLEQKEGADEEPVRAYAEAVSTDKEPVRADEEPVIADEQLVTADEEAVREDEQPIGADEEPLIKDEKPVGVDEQPVRKDEQPLREDEEPASADEEQVRAVEEPERAEAEPVTADENTRTRKSRFYRLLREDEDPVRFGIKAKNPKAQKDLTEHVSFGSRGHKSQYISCSDILSGSIELGRQNYHSNLIRIAVIDAEQLAETSGIIIHDLDTLLRRLKTDRAQKFARRFNEVVIEGNIGHECIVEVVQVERFQCNYKPPVSLYVKDGFVEESEMRKAQIHSLLGCASPPEVSSEEQSQEKQEILTGT